MCIGLEDNLNAMRKFASYLKWISQEKELICLEINELYLSKKKWDTILKPIHDQVQSLDEHHYVIAPTVQQESLESILSIECREFYITFWANTIPQVIPQAKLAKQPEEVYLRQLGDFDPVIFLSPNHKHMEIMSLDKEWLVRCSQFVDDNA